MNVDHDDPLLVVKCTALVPHFFQDISGDIQATNEKLREVTKGIELDPYENGVILQANNFPNLQEILSRLWQIDLTQTPGVREFGLWDVEVLKNTGTEDPSLVIRSAHLLCEKIFTRKKTETCSSKSD